jgi:glycosyltransferase involved in cell wall biosynthesis
MIFSGYKIHHLDLSADVHPLHEVSDPAHYCVFWYQSIPLGECYLSSTERISVKQFWENCLQAISASLEKYASQYTEELEAIKRMTPDLSSIQTVCATVLSHVQPDSFSDRSEISVVICTRNRHQSLKNCLQKLQEQRCRPREIVVVDNASHTDDTRKVAEEFNVRYVRENTPGLDVARNTGARSARGSVVAYTDDDTLPDPWWIYRIAETFSNPSVAAMTGLVLAASLETEAEVIFEKFWPFNRGYLEKFFDHKYFTGSLKNGPPVWEIGAGANMAFRREIFEEVGYFDERLDVGAAGCSGDSELWYRTLACGFVIQYNPLAVVHHSHRNSISGLRRQLYSYMRGFTVAILIQYQRFGHRGNLEHLFRVLPFYYLSLLKKGFPHYDFQYKTLFSEMRGILSGFIYYLRHRNTDSKIYSNDAF